MEVSTFLESVDWHAKPAPKAVRSVKLLRVHPMEPLSGWWVSSQLLTIMGHWDGKDFWPHCKDKARCPGCRLGHPFKRRGFGLFRAEHRDKLYAVELTAGCMKDDQLLEGKAGSIRGKYFTLQRRRPKTGGNPTKYSPLDLIWGPKPPPERLSAEFDFRGSLGLIFGLIPDIEGNDRVGEWEGGGQ